MFREYLNPESHTEFTVDLYYDRSSRLKCIVPRQRIEIRGGEVSKGVTRKNKLIHFLSDRIEFLDGARGCITLQVFVHNDTENVYGIEINPRFGGGYPLSYHAGANYPKWIIEEYYLNKEINRFDEWKDNLLMLRYDEEIIVNDFEN
jgi:carbamoyl-phosphate synthase large subunit